jgi:hypothetical protein
VATSRKSAVRCARAGLVVMSLREIDGSKNHTRTCDIYMAANLESSSRLDGYAVHGRQGTATSPQSSYLSLFSILLEPMTGAS